MPKNQLLSYKISTAQSLAASGNSAVTNIQFLDNIGIQVNILSGTPTGSFQVQISADYKQDNNGNVLVAGNWIDLTTAILAVTAGSPAQLYFDLNQLSSPWIRLRYVRTSGTGTADAFITAKQV